MAVPSLKESGLTAASRSIGMSYFRAVPAFIAIFHSSMLHGRGGARLKLAFVMSLASPSRPDE